MITIRKSAERGQFQEDWLDSRDTFSFDTYHDPQHMNFRTLRVINEDKVAPGKGFPLHPHRDMEILTFIIEGALQHEDDLGNREIIGAGEVQRITAGRGIRHAESNPSDREPVHLLQIWILPEEKGLEPSYEMKRFATGEKNRLQLLASRDGREGSAVIRQNVLVYTSLLETGKTLEYPLNEGRYAWLQLISGALTVNGMPLESGDGASAGSERLLRVAATDAARFILFDLN